MRRATALALVLLAAMASPAAADGTVGEVSDPTPVDAWAGRLIWSERVNSDLQPAPCALRLTTPVAF